MFMLPPRRAAVVLVLFAAALITLSKTVMYGKIPGTHDLLDTIIQSQIQYGTPVELQANPWSSSDGPLHASLHSYDPKLPVVNPHIKHILHCDLAHNDYTHHIRLPNTPFLNISMRTAEQDIEPSSRYFNPTLIPLPAWSPHPYLLVSRLATAGFHQESHVCLASLCLPKTPHGRLPIDTKACTDAELELLGPAGGLHCITPPQRLNIPTTPTWRCETSWSMYPDIPGFHDPRVFWSGKGEPLAIINSGSQYGCVGLWVVDLRAIYRELDEAIRKGGGKLAQSKMSYPYVTEITRNGQRDLIEKNWVLFFPRGEEAWVMYDMFMHGEKKQGHRGGGQMKAGGQDDVQTGRSDVVREGESHDVAADHVEVVTLNPSFESTANRALNLSSLLGSRLLIEASPDSNGTIDAHNRSSLLGSIVNSDATTNNLTVSNIAHRKRSESINPTPFDEFRYQKAQIHPSRSLAKLIGNGYTTPNLTSPFESPCFNNTHIHDVLGNIGHWHQGTNSLRLVLCRRPTAASTPEQKQEECVLTDSNEEELVQEGRVLHVMILHRKFSNEMKLPMMYERYFMVWEARWPFRVVGINQYPILFEDEMAKPWSLEENLPAEDQPENEEERRRLQRQRARWKDVYFTYTPSLAWAWRGPANQDAMGERALGTGYLGDEVVVGIGVDDVAQVVVREKIERLLSCLRLCPDFEGNADI